MNRCKNPQLLIAIEVFYHIIFKNSIDSSAIPVKFARQFPRVSRTNSTEISTISFADKCRMDREDKAEKEENDSPVSSQVGNIGNYLYRPLFGQILRGRWRPLRP